jgi:hypothetical protein
MAITVSGTTITFNDATTQTTAASGSTTFNTVGSVGYLVYDGATNIVAGNTVAGTSLYYASTVVSNYQTSIITNGSIASGFYTRYNNGPSTRKDGTLPPVIIARPPLGMTALTGTWRAMNAVAKTEITGACCDGSYNNYAAMVFVRIS